MSAQPPAPTSNIWQSGKLQQRYSVNPNGDLNSSSKFIDENSSLSVKDENNYARQSTNYGRQQKGNHDKKALVTRSLDQQSKPFARFGRHKPANRKSFDINSGNGLQENSGGYHLYHPPNHQKFTISRAATPFNFFLGPTDESICRDRAGLAMHMQRIVQVEPIVELFNVYMMTDRCVS